MRENGKVITEYTSILSQEYRTLYCNLRIFAQSF